ncbi:MAG TPA: hypothetical protein VFB58_02175 [Chloroflexota bacterium]|nr:hypothetical protein [Chloroflexota bacterium]
MLATEEPLLATEIVVEEPRHIHREVGVLGYLDALTYEFERDGAAISCVLTYAQPDPDHRGKYQMVVAADTGYEGIACLDDTARAALLALQVYERTGSRKALSLARKWLTFVNYMQYEDGTFANFIRNEAGVRNASGLTSVRGGHAWTSRALWALATAYRITGDESYRDAYERCRLPVTADNKINAVVALAAMEMWQADPTDATRAPIMDRIERIVGDGDEPYFPDLPGQEHVELWGYHQLHAVARAAHLLEDRALLAPCRATVNNLVQPDVRAMFWYDYPERRKTGLCAYNVAPIVQGLAAMYRATGAERYRDLALKGAAWFYGRNDGGATMYDPATGMCRDGMTDGIPSENFGAESSIEAGFAELARRSLDDLP